MNFLHLQTSILGSSPADDPEDNMDHQHQACRKNFVEAADTFQVKTLQMKLVLHADKKSFGEKFLTGEFFLKQTWEGRLAPSVFIISLPLLFSVFLNLLT